MKKAKEIFYRAIFIAGSASMLMDYQITNQHLTATIASKGAELTSLVHNTAGTEYIWQADPAHWGRHTPVLFPIVGKLLDDQYIHEGNSYHMAQHGFARDMEFALAYQSEDEISLVLRKTEKTMTVYPFAFEMTIKYRLHGPQLFTSYEVKNTGNGAMLFSIGGHPAFNCPVGGVGQRSDYGLKFDQYEHTSIHYLTQGCFAGEKEVFQGQYIKLREGLFDKDALVFEGLRSRNVALLGPNEKPILTFHFEGFPYLGIWSKSRQSPFVCIEPWHGLADNAGHDKVLSNKKGIIALEAAGKFSCTYGVHIH